MSSFGAGSSIVLCASPVASSGIPSWNSTPADELAAIVHPASQIPAANASQLSGDAASTCHTDILLTQASPQKHCSRYQSDEEPLHNLSLADGMFHNQPSFNTDELENPSSQSSDEDAVYQQRTPAEITLANLATQRVRTGHTPEIQSSSCFHNVVFHPVHLHGGTDVSDDSDCGRGGMPDQSLKNSPPRKHARGNMLGASLEFVRKLSKHHPPPMMKPMPSGKKPAVSFSVDGGLYGSKQTATIPVDVAKLKRNLSGPLPWSKEMEERIEVLGPHLDASQKILLWLGILLDIITKLSIMRELNRYAQTNEWPWFSMLLVFFVFSSTCVTIYWWTHYPVFSSSDGLPDRRRDSGPDATVYGWSKSDVKRLIRNMGAVFAFCGLGTCFLAVRALFASDKRQRGIAFDLRGMRLVDTLFLTLVLCLLQVYIGMMCTNPAVQCKGHNGFDTILLLSILSSLSSASLCYTALDLNDLRIMYDPKHQIETAAFFFMRLLELGARTQLLAIFAVLRHGHIFVVFVGHMLLVVFLLRFSPGAQQLKAWRKVSSCHRLNCGCFSILVPKADDMKLLVACLVWPPSCYVSDATAKSGAFWWRARTAAKRPFWNITLSQSLLPWPVWMVMMSVEAIAMYFTLTPLLRTQPWAAYHLQVTVVLHLLWLLFAALWVSTVHMVAAASSKDAMNRALARHLICEGQEFAGLPSRTGSASSMVTLTQVVVDADSDEGSPKFSSKRYPAFPLACSAPAVSTRSRDQNATHTQPSTATTSTASSPSASPPRAPQSHAGQQLPSPQLPPLERYEVPTPSDASTLTTTSSSDVSLLPPGQTSPTNARSRLSAAVPRPSPLSRASTFPYNTGDTSSKAQSSHMVARPVAEQNLQQMVQMKKLSLQE